ncbi:hypothetical protein AGMMS49928_28350 [Spirochaetia bacterium]|nr:hypothetical protein AGMMS49928_28350 [Spirochaetia bacterium]
MSKPTTPDKEDLRSLALAAGFFRVSFLSPFVSVNTQGAPSLLTAALVYGNCFSDELSPGSGPDLPRAFIAPFARRNYYREAVKRLQGLSKEFRSKFGGEKSDFRILCNSPVPEKPLAAASGLGALGRNGLILTKEAGSLFIIAAMTLPWELPGDDATPEGFPLCSLCDPLHPPCAASCPTGAVRGDGTLTLSKCIQWYASGHGDVPEEVRRWWGKRLYGCTECQDACVWNRQIIKGVETAEGPLPAFFDPQELLDMDDESLKKRFRGTALGLSWLGPAVIKGNASRVLHL